MGYKIDRQGLIPSREHSLSSTEHPGPTQFPTKREAGAFYLGVKQNEHEAHLTFIYRQGQEWWCYTSIPPNLHGTVLPYWDKGSNVPLHTYSKLIKTLQISYWRENLTRKGSGHMSHFLNCKLNLVKLELTLQFAVNEEWFYDCARFALWCFQCLVHCTDDTLPVHCSICKNIYT